MDTNVDHCTVATTSISIKFNDLELATATGFYWIHKGQTYLVTNWHNVSGRNPKTGALLSKEGAIPNRLEVDGFRNRNLQQRIHIAFDLYRQDETPFWLEHPIWRSAADVVCLPIGDASQHTYPLNEERVLDMSFQVGEDVFAIGYPRGLSTDRLALWKRASIASEPDIEVDGLPFVYVDTATSKGMSGSPVLRRVRGGPYLRKNGITALGEHGFALLGVYAGREVGNEANEVVLGRVWKARLIQEIIDAKCMGSQEVRAPLSFP